jgi:hypothetical protein
MSDRLPRGKRPLRFDTPSGRQLLTNLIDLGADGDLDVLGGMDLRGLNTNL